MTRSSYARDGVLAGAALLLGWWAHGASRPVQAASPDVAYQLEGIGPTTSLSIYNAADHSIYVYPNATAGNTHLNCSYRFRLGSVGGPIERENCGMGSPTH
jgi:hypothetical protein